MTMDFDTWYAMRADEGYQGEEEELDDGYFDEDAAFEAAREGF